MSTGIIGQQVEFVLSGIHYAGKVIGEHGDQLTIDAIQEGATQCSMLVSRELVFPVPGQPSQPPTSKDPLVEAGQGSGRGYTG